MVGLYRKIIDMKVSLLSFDAIVALLLPRCFFVELTKPSDPIS